MEGNYRLDSRTERGEIYIARRRGSNQGVRLPQEGVGGGCRLQSCGNSAAIFTCLPTQSLDRPVFPCGLMKFETRHPPHTPLLTIGFWCRVCNFMARIRKIWPANLTSSLRQIHFHFLIRNQDGVHRNYLKEAKPRNWSNEDAADGVRLLP